MSHPLKATVRAPVKRAPRYEARERNGAWQVFDTYLYTAVDSKTGALAEGMVRALVADFNRADAEKRRP